MKQKQSLSLLVLLILLLSCSLPDKEGQKAKDRLREMGIEFSEHNFFSSVIQNRPEVVKLFLKAGMNPSTAQDEKTVLLEACRRGHTEIGLALIEAGSRINAKDRYGVTCLMFASITGSAELIHRLIDQGADVNAKDSYGRTALIEALTTENDLPLKTFQALIDGGADVNTRIDGGQTPLMLAASGDDEILRILIDAGADVNARDDAGVTVLQRARDVPPNFEILKKAGANE